MAKLILFTGGLATLKTTISNQIAQDLGILCVNKDDVKASLVDVIGFSNREDNKKLSVATVEVMIQLASKAKQSNTSIILEANFKKHELEKIKEISGFNSEDILTLFLYGEPKVLYDRYVRRQATRHIAHTSMGLMDFEIFKASLDEHRMEDGLGTVMTIYTTPFEEEDYQTLKIKLQDYLNEMRESNVI